MRGITMTNVSTFVSIAEGIGGVGSLPVIVPSMVLAISLFYIIIIVILVTGVSGSALTDSKTFSSCYTN